MILTHLVLFSFLGGAGGAEAPPAVPETFSGGWARAFRDETGTEREARIHADRIRLGIIEPDAESPVGAALVAALPSDTGQPQGLPLHPDLAEMLAELHTSAYLDAEIARHFLLQDEDDAAVLLIAVATLH